METGLDRKASSRLRKLQRATRARALLFVQHRALHARRGGHSLVESSRVEHLEPATWSALLLLGKCSAQRYQTPRNIQPIGIQSRRVCVCVRAFLFRICSFDEEPSRSTEQRARSPVRECSDAKTRTAEAQNGQQLAVLGGGGKWACCLSNDDASAALIPSTQQYSEAVFTPLLRHR